MKFDKYIIKNYTDYKQQNNGKVFIWKTSVEIGGKDLTIL